MATLVKQVRQVAGVKKVKVIDFKKGHIVASPKPGKSISARALWDAVDSAGFTPSKLVTPFHEYTERPPK